MEGGRFSGVALELQTLLEQKKINLGFVRTTLDDLFAVMEEDLNIRLQEMVELFKEQPKIAMACGATGSVSRPGVCDGWDDTNTREQQNMSAKVCREGNRERPRYVCFRNKNYSTAHSDLHDVRAVRDTCTLLSL